MIYILNVAPSQPESAPQTVTSRKCIVIRHVPVIGTIDVQADGTFTGWPLPLVHVSVEEWSAEVLLEQIRTES